MKMEEFLGTITKPTAYVFQWTCVYPLGTHFKESYKLILCRYAIEGYS